MHTVPAFLLLALMCCGSWAAAPAETGTDEIEHLLMYLKNSHCELARNGTWYSARRAEEHLRSKYDALLKNGAAITTAESFIDQVASHSNVSGHPYLVRCDNDPAIESGSWFREALQRLRTERLTPNSPLQPTSGSSLRSSPAAAELQRYAASTSFADQSYPSRGENCMAVNPVREGFNTITPYLLVEGVAQLLTFLPQAFAAQILAREARPDGTIMHAEARIGGSMLMMGEASSDFGPMPTSISLYVADCDAVYKRALQAGGTSVFGVMDLPSGDRYGGVKDPCGNIWWIASHVEDLSPEEQAARWREFQRG